MKKLVFLMLTASLITACSSEDLSPGAETAQTTNQSATSSVSVSNEGYLVFPTVQSLQNFVEQYSEDGAGASLLRLTSFIKSPTTGLSSIISLRVNAINLSC